MDVQVPVMGLTTAEAEAARRRGEANTAVSGTSRTYATILRTNVFSFYNSILFVIGATLLALGRYSVGFPYSPTQVGLTLLTVGVPTLFLTFWARPTAPDEHLLADLGRFVLPAAIITAGFGTAVYAFLYTRVSQGFSTGRTPDEVIAAFEGYTGLAYGTDTDFTEAAATLGAQTGLSTFVSLASFGLILFLCPPTRFFAAWTRPTGPAAPVFTIVLPALVLWFGTLTAAYRLRLPDRVLGLDTFP